VYASNTPIGKQHYPKDFKATGFKRKEFEYFLPN